MTSPPSARAERQGGASPTSRQVRCWQCGTAHPVRLFCPACEAIQPFPPQADYFEILGIPRRLVLDAGELQRCYFELSRRLHPDRYQTAAAPARIASLGNTALLNRAYRTLRDPVERGLYWLSLQGEQLGSNNNQVPGELAALVFDVQDTLETLRRADGTAGTLVQEVRRIRTQLIERRDGLLVELARNFSRWDAGDGDRDSMTQELKAVLSALRYVGTLVRDVDKELER